MILKRRFDELLAGIPGDEARAQSEFAFAQRPPPKAQKSFQFAPRRREGGGQCQDFLSSPWTSPADGPTLQARAPLAPTSLPAGRQQGSLRVTPGDERAKGQAPHLTVRLADRDRLQRELTPPLSSGDTRASGRADDAPIAGAAAVGARSLTVDVPVARQDRQGVGSTAPAVDFRFSRTQMTPAPAFTFDLRRERALPEPCRPSIPAASPGPGREDSLGMGKGTARKDMAKSPTATLMSAQRVPGQGKAVRAQHVPHASLAVPEQPEVDPSPTVRAAEGPMLDDARSYGERTGTCASASALDEDAGHGHDTRATSSAYKTESLADLEAGYPDSLINGRDPSERGEHHSRDGGATEKQLEALNTMQEIIVKLRQKDAELEQLKAHNVALAKSDAARSKKLRSLKARAEAAAKRADDIMTDWREHRERYTSALAVARQEQVEISALRKEIRSCLEGASMQGHLPDVVQHIRDELTTCAKVSNEQTRAAVESADLQRQRAEQALFDLAGERDRCKELRQDWKAASESLAGKVALIAELEGQRSDAKATQLRDAEELRSAKERVNSLSTELHQARQALTEAKAAASETQLAITAAEQRAAELQHGLDLSEARERASQEAHARIYQELDEARSIVGAKEGELNELRLKLGEAARSELEKEKLRGELDQLRSSNSALIAAAGEAAVDKEAFAVLRAELEQARQKIEQVEEAAKVGERAIEAQQTLLPRYFSKRLTDEENRMVRAIAMHWKAKYEERMLKRAEIIQELEASKRKLEDENQSLREGIESIVQQLNEREAKPQDEDEAAAATEHAASHALYQPGRRRRGILLDSYSPVGSPVPDSDGSGLGEAAPAPRQATTTDTTDATREVGEGTGDGNSARHAELSEADAGGEQEVPEHRPTTTVNQSGVTTGAADHAAPSSTDAPDAPSQDQQAQSARPRVRRRAKRAATRPSGPQENRDGGDGEAGGSGSAAGPVRRRSTSGYDLRPFRR
ncbi:uncharacterized protein PFL1_06661 [Pseudozyma flocculosa PF-1]|uniref:Uncharacterized protein n=1 Tax=Pseudozyma flocculosa PF-1 TaxID=1277687 RepID=A0A061H147_9BASI|nr:uncharacterized protein PFL1_06661 [Pseudozyma flocculosa PF-1]EPQ25794.1 hypothetical protein PFL1_06661 [Pseudozyma flocculosa PF-1]